MCNHLSFLLIVDRPFDPWPAGTLEVYGGSVSGMSQDHEYCVNFCASYGGVEAVEAIRTRKYLADVKLALTFLSIRMTMCGLRLHYRAPVPTVCRRFRLEKKCRSLPSGH